MVGVRGRKGGEREEKEPSTGRKGGGRERIEYRSFSGARENGGGRMGLGERRGGRKRKWSPVREGRGEGGEEKI